MSREARLLGQLRPYTPLFLATIAATVMASVFDGFTFVLLIPFLRTLFGRPVLPDEASGVERLLDAVAGPFLRAGSPDVALRNVVMVLLAALVLKNVATYLASLGSVAIQENVVRDLRVQLFRHLQTLPLGFFQRTKAGQLLSRIVNDTDQVKTAISAALASLLQNVVVIAVYVAIMFGLSPRLSVMALVLAPALLFIIRPVVARLRRRSKELAAERGELTSHVGEMVGAVKLVRAYTGEVLEAERFSTIAERYRKRVLRAQRFSSLTSPLSEVFAGVVTVLILWFGTRLVLGGSSSLGPEQLIAFLAVALL